MKKTIRKINPYFILAIIILFHLTTTFIWLKIDKSYLKLDAWGHYRYSLEAYDFLKGIPHLKFPLSAVEPQKWHGILVGFSTALLYFVFGKAQDAAIMINSAIFLTILVLSTYGIAKRIYSSSAGLLAAFIVTSYPVIFNNLRIYMLDLPLTGMVALSLYFLIASDNFSDRKNSPLFGLSFGLGILVKFNYIAFIIGSLLLTLYLAITQKPSLYKNTIRNIIYLITVAVFLCAIFYIVKSRDILQRIYQLSNLGIFKDYKPNFFNFLSWRVSWILNFIETSISEGTSFLFLILFVVGFVFFIKAALKERWKLYLALIVPLFMQIFLFSIEPACMFRYSMPFLPILAIITSIGLLGIKNRALKITFLFLLVTFGVLQFFAVSYGISVLPEKIKFTLIRKWPYNLDLVVFQQNMGVTPFLKDKTSHPSTADWRSTQALNAIINSNVSRERVKVLLLSNIPELIEAMDYQILINRKLIDTMPVTSITVEKFYEKRFAPLDMICTTADYIIISNNTDSVWEAFLNSDPVWKEKIEKARTVFHQNIDHFKLIQTLRLPDGSDLFIYKNTYKKPELIESQGIQQGNIRLLFDSGRARIFYKNTELTKGLGLYTSLFSLQHWRDSMEATWEVKKLSNTKLFVKGRWMFIPVIQTWEIELKNGNIIEWRVKIEAEDIIKVEIEDFKLMLSDKYKEWFISSGENGIFSDYFEKNLWKKFWEGNINCRVGVKAVNIQNTSLPSVKFRVFQMPSTSLTSVENSDQLFNGRVIGCFKNNLTPNNLFSPGQYEYFNAEISIE